MPQFVTLKPIDDRPRWRVIAGGEDVGTVAFAQASDSYEFHSSSRPLDADERREVREFLDTLNS